MNWVQKLYDKIKAWKGPEWLRVIGDKVQELLKHVFNFAVSYGVEAMRDIAREVISDISNDPKLVTDKAKRNAAFKRIKARLLEEGMTIKDSVINLGIELVVNELKNLGKLL